MFAVGNISPDCGFRNDDGTYQPAPHVTHFQDEEYRAAHPERFYNEYIAGQQHDREELSFLLGYYAHLLLDVEWAVDVYRPKCKTPLLKAGLDQDDQFIAKKIWKQHANETTSICPKQRWIRSSQTQQWC